MATNELEGTRPAPAGEIVEIPGNETEPEQIDEQLNTDDNEAGEVEEPGEAEANDEGETVREGRTVDHEPNKEPEAKPEKKKLSWEIRRINELTAKQREAEKRAAEAETALAKYQGTTTEEREAASKEPLSVEEIRKQEREAIRREERLHAETERFNEACNAVFEKGVNDIPDFLDARDTLMNALGDEVARKPEFLQIITELDNGHQVFAELGRNPEEAERILKLSPVKMALEIAKMSDKVSKPTAKPISKVPAPVTPIGGKTVKANRMEDPDVPMETFANEFLTMMAGKGR